MSIREVYEKNEDEHLKFDNVLKKRASRPDVHAFIVLDELFPRDRDLVCHSEHDVIYFDVSDEEMETIPPEIVLDLLRCGVLYDESTDSLMMFT